MSEKTITTVSGKEAYENECELINGVYYLIGDINIENSGDIFKINNKFIKLDSGRLIYNYSEQIYELISTTKCIKGIVNYNSENNELLYGYFEFNSLYDYNVYLENGTHQPCFRDVKLPLSYREKKSSGDFYHIKLLTTDEFLEIQKINKELKESFSYDSKNVIELYKKTFDFNYKPDYLDISKKIANILGDLTFGFEFETTNGIIPNNKIKNLPLIPLRDGSINGLEYATLPLSGELGIQALIDSVNELSKRTTYDSSCSLHLHIGNIPRTPEFILAFYKLYSIFSDEMFEMFPLYKKYNFGVKRKHYTKPYNFIKLNSVLNPKLNNKEDILKDFSILFNYLIESKSTGVHFKDFNNDLNNVNNHPKNNNDNAKWNINTRYHVVNFIPLIFGNKQTIEFRIHTPTYNLYKIINFLIINSILINFSKNNYKTILKDYSTIVNSFKNLKEFLNVYIKRCKNIKGFNNTLIEELCKYIDHRKDFVYMKNIQGETNFNEDEFKYRGYLDFKTKVPNAKTNNLKKFETTQAFGHIDNIKYEYDDINLKPNSESVKKIVLNDDFTIKYVDPLYEKIKRSMLLEPFYYDSYSNKVDTDNLINELLDNNEKIIQNITKNEPDNGNNS